MAAAQRSPALWMNGVVGLVILTFAWVTARYALRNSYFIGDDYDHFQLIGSMSFLQYLFTPIDVHFVPLHRLFSWLLLRLAPLNFDLAVAVLMAFQLAATLLLALLLGRLRPGPWNATLLVVFACNSLLLPLLVWWSAGIHRFPYVLLSIACLYFYLGYREQHRWRQLVAAWACLVLAFGFYSKAVLIPVYVLALEFCLSWRLGFAVLRRYAVGASMLLAVIGYVVWYVLYAPVTRPAGTASISVAVEITLAFMRTMADLLVLRQPGPWSLVGGGVLVAWGLVMLVTCLKRRENLIYWLVLLGLVALNFLVIGVSSRGQMFGAYLAGIPRYYFEVLFLPVIFFSLILNPSSSQYSGEGIRGRYTGVLAIGLAVLYPLLAYLSAKAQFIEYGEVHKQAHHYMTRLLANLDELPADRPVRIAEGNLPLYVYGDWLRVYKPFAVVLPLRYPNLEFVARDVAQYEIDQDGQLKPLPSP
ncbi:hypothetical protein [Pseudomonas nitroreducens]|uniref:hypothetical protein n=1 Tax=Pseudomonas nitroreducens TaxID=46680 RepID=UPI00209DD4A5|nr:hypothetical protein [Pseudomonas nitroreducens]MCP1621614.1 hypothetical protein [Pseudomonas nitroreducens]